MLMLLDTLRFDEVHRQNSASEDTEADTQGNAYVHAYIESILSIDTFLSKD